MPKSDDIPDIGEQVIWKTLAYIYRVHSYLPKNRVYLLYNDPSGPNKYKPQEGIVLLEDIERAGPGYRLILGTKVKPGDQRWLSGENTWQDPNGRSEFPDYAIVRRRIDQ